MIVSTFAKLRAQILKTPFFLALFLGVGFTLPLILFTPGIGGAKHDGYLELAENLVQGNGYVFASGDLPVFHRPPLYATLLVPGVTLPRPFWPFYVVLINSSLFAASGWLLLKSIQRYFNDEIAAAAWLIFVLNPFMLYSIKNPMPPHAQVLSYLLIVRLGIDLFVKLCRKESLPRIFFAGFVCALFAGSMCHATMLANAILWIAFLAFVSIWRCGCAHLSEIICSAACLVLLVFPWTWRNYSVTGFILPVAGNAGVAYFAGNAHWGITSPPQMRGENEAQALFRHGGLSTETRMHFYGLVDPGDEKNLNHRMIDHIQKNPGAVVRKSILNGTEYFFPVTYFLVMKKKVPIEPLAITFYYAALLALSARGCITLISKNETRPAGIALGLFTIAYAAPYFPFLTFVGHSLYTFGTLPFLSALAGVAANYGPAPKLNQSHLESAQIRNLPIP